MRSLPNLYFERKTVGVSPWIKQNCLKAI